MALLGGPRRDVDPYLADDIAERAKEIAQGDDMGPREIDELADRAVDVWEQTSAWGWGE